MGRPIITSLLQNNELKHDIRDLREEKEAHESRIADQTVQDKISHANVERLREDLQASEKEKASLQEQLTLLQNAPVQAQVHNNVLRTPSPRHSAPSHHTSPDRDTQRTSAKQLDESQHSDAEASPADEVSFSLDMRSA